MTVASEPRNRYVERPEPSRIEDVVDAILDKGLVVDFTARVSLLGVEILFVDGRVVMASIDTYLRFAETVRRMELGGLPDQRSSVPRRSATA